MTTEALPLHSQLRLAGRLVSGLRSFLREPLTPGVCRDRIEQGLRRRQTNFLGLLEQTVFTRSSHVYAKLLAHAGIGVEDLRHAVSANGLEATLEMLYDNGVFLRLDEFKGRRPVRRGSLEFEVSSQEFDNPLAAGHLVTESGGSRGSRTRVYIDLAHYAQDAVYEYFFLLSQNALDRPAALWRPVPPYAAGIHGVLRLAKLGRSAEKWFSQDPLRMRGRTWKHGLVTAYVVAASRLHGRALPRPEHVPLEEAWRVAEWLAAKKRTGTPAWLNTNAACAARVCMAARDRGLDISGTLFRTGGEPLTAARARLIHDAGGRATCYYTMGETGRLGLACAAPNAIDEVHLLTDKVALIRRDIARAGGASVLANVYTTLLPTMPKLLLNVESDDYGILERRHCGCPIGALGYDLHFHTIRSHEKLTSEGMNFLGFDLARLVDEVLPARFGGDPTDYQFVEEEADGLPRVDLVVSPRVGEVDPAALVDAVVDFLNDVPGASADYGERWREAGTLRVVRREPYATAASKVLALHVLNRKSGRRHDGPS